MSKNKVSRVFKYEDDNDLLIFDIDKEGGFEIISHNNKPIPQDRNSQEYSKFIFDTMFIMVKVIEEFDRRGLINKD